MIRPIDPSLLRAVPALRRYLAALAVLQAASAFLVVAQALLLASAIATVFAHHQTADSLAPILVMLCLVGVGRAGISAVQETLGRRACVQVRAELRARTLQAIRRLGPAWVRRQESGRLVHAAGPGLDGLDGYLARALPAVVGAATIPGLVLLVITLQDWQTGLLLIVMLPLVPIFMALVGITTKRRVQRQYVLLGRLAGQFLDLLRGLPSLRIYGQAERQARTLEAATERYRTETMSALRVTFLSALVLDLVATLSVAVVAVDVGVRLDSGAMAFSTALAVLLLAPEVFAPLRAMGAQFHASEEGAAAAGACLDIIGEAPAAHSPGDAVRCSGSVALDGVSVNYPGRHAPALRGLHLAIQPGECVALVGSSGAGKSSVLALLLGFVQPDWGAVLVNVEQDLRELDADSWRRNVAWVPQRPVPTQQTIAAELRLGDPEASDEQLTTVCALCGAPDPATTLGEDGREVSAGQRRRIALARAVLRARAVRRESGCPVVLLDEPSEDLDERTELVVARVIESMRGWATVVIATHSGVIAAMAQRRVTLDRGRVVANIVQQPLDPDLPGAAPMSARAGAAGAAGAVQAAAAEPLRVRASSRDGRRGVALAATLSALAGLAGLALTSTSVWLISRAAQHPNLQALSIAVVGVRTFALVRAGLRYLERLAAHDAALRVLTGLRVRVFAALGRAGSAGAGGYGRGDLLRRFVRDVDGVQDGLVRTWLPLAGAVATGCAAVVVVGLLVPAAGLILAAALAIAGAVLPWLALRSAGEQRPVADLVGRREAAVTAFVEGVDELTAYGADGVAVGAITRTDEQVELLSRRATRAAAGGTFLAGVLLAVALPLVVLAGSRAVRAGKLPVVDLGVLAVCVLVAFEGVTSLPAAFASWAQCRAGLARVGAVLGAAPAFGEPTEPVPPGELALRGEDLAVAPAAHAQPVVRDACLLVEAGHRVAVTGPSGCGKSTLLAAVLRQLPASGTLALVGATRAVAVVDAHPLPASIAGSLQGDHVFDATLRDNLRVVRPDACDAELDAVAARAGLTDFVAELPNGWSTPVGADGARLSGGQRQRLLLARALLAAPNILVLDEPTAHLDADTERAVLRDLFAATRGQTLLITTHRQSAADGCDQILRIVDGELVRRTLGSVGGACRRQTVEETSRLKE